MPVADSSEGRHWSLHEDCVCPSLRQWLLCVCSDRVQALCYLQLTRQLVSCSSDGGIAVWNMDVSREEVRGSKAGLTRGGPPARLLVFRRLAGDAGSPSSSPLCFLVASNAVLCVTVAVSSTHWRVSTGTSSTHTGHLGWFSQRSAWRGRWRQSSPSREWTAGRCSKVLLHTCHGVPKTLTRDIAHLGTYFPILCFYFPRALSHWVRVTLVFFSGDLSLSALISSSPFLLLSSEVIEWDDF